MLIRKYNSDAVGLIWKKNRNRLRMYLLVKNKTHVQNSFKYFKNFYHDNCIYSLTKPRQHYKISIKVVIANELLKI